MANFNFNKVMLGGRLTAAPELKQTQSGIPVCTFSMAVKRRFGGDAANGKEPPTDFFNVTAWRQTGEFVQKYFTKGSSIFVVGTLQNRSWTDQQGVKHYATDILADEVGFVDSRSEAPAANATPGGYVPDAYTAPSTAGTSGGMNTMADEDLPF